jgi:hypothetical protein
MEDENKNTGHQEIDQPPALRALENLRIAPLFLVPVRLHKGRLNREISTYEYTLGYSGEDIIPNLSLREKLRFDFAMSLPELDENTVSLPSLMPWPSLLRQGSIPIKA